MSVCQTGPINFIFQTFGRFFSSINLHIPRYRTTREFSLKGKDHYGWPPCTS